MSDYRSIAWAITCLVVTVFCGSLTTIVTIDIGYPFWPGILLTVIFWAWCIRTICCNISDRQARAWSVKCNRYRKQQRSE